MEFFKLTTFRMKKIALLLLAITPVFTGYSQKAKGYNAVNYYKDYLSSKDVESLKKAKENVDLASEHIDTKDNPQIQVTKGQIYFALYEINKKANEDMLATTISDPNKRAFASFLSTPTTELEIAYTAFEKGKKLDVKGDYTNELKTVKNIGIYFDNTGRANLNEKNFNKALPCFERAYEISGYSDTTLLYFCGVSAEFSNEYAKAKEYYQKMIDTKHVRENTYVSLVNVCFNMKDTIAGIEAMKKGRVADPNNINLVIIEANYFLRTNNSPKALNNLNIAISARPADPNLYLVRGNIYDNLANPKDATGKELEKPTDYENDIKNAEADYKKAIELKPDNFDALYNLGVLYNNQGVVYNKQADEIMDNAKNAAANAKATALFEKAIPVLENALQINPNDRSTMIALKQIYARLQLLDKLKVINEKLNK